MRVIILHFLKIYSHNYKCSLLELNVEKIARMCENYGVARTLHCITFTVSEEGNRTCSSSGNHSLAILKVHKSELWDAM